MDQLPRDPALGLATRGALRLVEVGPGKLHRNRAAGELVVRGTNVRHPAAADDAARPVATGEQAVGDFGVLLAHGASG
jgi:hypothetical protein